MAASGYMTEADVESIWDTTWVTARFDLINVRIAELINIFFNDDATSNITDTAVLPYLEQIAEELLLELALAAKANKFSDTWQFIQANVTHFFVAKMNRNKWLNDHIFKILGKTETVEIVNLSGLGSSNTL
jgi:hypothetical protein